jgi:hypothetical protein
VHPIDPEDPMPRTPNPLILVALLLAAATAGCSTPFGKGATVLADPPSLLTALPDGPDVALLSTPSPEPAGIIQVGPTAAPSVKTAAAGRTNRATRVARSEAAKASAPEAPSASAGPSVTTYVYADAPVAVRQGVAREAPAGRTAVVPSGFNPYRIAMPSGAYRCEFGRSVQVRDVSADRRTAVLRWGSRDFTLRAVQARSGALRYEDETSGLAWIVIPGTSMLLDTREGQRLANACRA